MNPNNINMLIIINKKTPNLLNRYIYCIFLFRISLYLLLYSLLNNGAYYCKCHSQLDSFELKWWGCHCKFRLQKISRSCKNHLSTTSINRETVFEEMYLDMTLKVQNLVNDFSFDHEILQRFWRQQVKKWWYGYWERHLLIWC